MPDYSSDEDPRPRRSRTHRDSSRHHRRSESHRQGDKNRRSESRRREDRSHRDRRQSASRSPTRRKSSKSGRAAAVESSSHRRSESTRRHHRSNSESERRRSRGHSTSERKHRHTSSGGEPRRQDSKRSSRRHSSEKRSSERRRSSSRRRERVPAVPVKASAPQRRRTTYRHGAWRDEELEDSDDDSVPVPVVPVMPVKGGYHMTPQEDPEPDYSGRGYGDHEPFPGDTTYLHGLDGHRDAGLSGLEGDAREVRKARKKTAADIERAEKEGRRRERRERRGNRSVLSALSGSVVGGLGMSEKRRKHLSLHSDDFDPGDPAERARGSCNWLGLSKWVWLGVAVTVILVIAVPAGVVSAKNKASADQGAVGGTPDPELGLGKGGETSLDPKDRDKVPTAYKNGLLDPWTWADTKDFNTTFTKEEVGGLPIMGLFDEWDDSTRANDHVPPLDEPFPYGEQPIRGINLGGWLIIEPFITPSFFKKYPLKLGIVDEWTLSEHLGPKKAAETLEEHYKSFVTELTIKEIREAGMDHVRIPFGYWAVETMKGDHFVPKISWRYLLRAIEWCRKYGLRVKLDLHSVPGGANGWNHSGRQDVINFINGPDGAENAKKTLEIHQKMATFFSQPRYKNIITMYGLVNEPKMVELDVKKTLSWSEDAYDVIRAAGYEGQIVFGDGFRGLKAWKGAFSGKKDMLLDVHQYTIFNVNLIAFTHSRKIDFACKEWKDEIDASMDKTSGFGPTMVGEWSQADTDCTEFLNNVGVGTRWEGTFNKDMEPTCAAKEGCSCKEANAPAEEYSDAYKKFLLMWIEAQMDTFERSYGWMYWTWDTEASVQWSYKKARDAGIAPKIAYERSFKCGDEIPDFEELGLPETY